ncbi:hypothetical protein B0H14DRAFT_3470138 [Mycena olivaceomarginata]|nr:hypothetical protein B0H14DRAFT_3470138 [Mycena olivaceomarginata]
MLFGTGDGTGESKGLGLYDGDIAQTERSAGKGSDYRTKVFCSRWIVWRKLVLHDECIVQHQRVSLDPRSHLLSSALPPLRVFSLSSLELLFCAAPSLRKISTINLLAANSVRCFHRAVLFNLLASQRGCLLTPRAQALEWQSVRFVRRLRCAKSLLQIYLPQTLFGASAVPFSSIHYWRGLSAHDEGAGVGMGRSLDQRLNERAPPVPADPPASTPQRPRRLCPSSPTRANVRNRCRKYPHHPPTRGQSLELLNERAPPVPADPPANTPQRPRLLCHLSPDARKCFGRRAMRKGGSKHV